ncbi:MAG TPA: hypothetical protein VGQ39_03135 [Pyrinomonadaceae bacterium]|nr:hypothetical protein [Pyrinomonadaceae bacterium]
MSPPRFFDVQPVDASTLASNLALLGYPGFAYLKSEGKKKPEEVLLSALSSDYLEGRAAEALPWLLVRYTDLDWPSLINTANAKGLQNKLGFLTCLARRVAEMRGETDKAAVLRNQERVLERSRLLAEDTFCNDSLTLSERRWLETNRTDDANTGES